MQATILAVDDTPNNITVLMEILRGDYRVLAATGGEASTPPRFCQSFSGPFAPNARWRRV